MAASINGALTQGLASLLQKLAKPGDAGSTTPDGANVSTTGAAATTTQPGKTKNGKDAAGSDALQPLDIVTLSAQAQQILANAQAPSNGPGSLATFLSTNNNTDTVNGISDIGNGFQGAIEQFRQWLSQPLGQPIPFPGDQSFDNVDSNTAPKDDTTAAKPATSTSA